MFNTSKFWLIQTIETNKIEKLEKKGLWPSGRNSQSFTLNEQKEEIVMFGGADKEGYKDDVFIFDIKT